MGGRNRAGGAAMKPLLLDTNILLRFITGEPAAQAKETADLVAAAEA